MPAAKPATSTLHEALLAAQGEMPDLVKDSTNPHFNSRFISLKGLLEQVLPILQAQGLLLLQPPAALEGDSPALTTILAHPATATEISFTTPLVLGKQDAQGQASAITYMRRYCLMSLLGLVADEDDDGNGASAAKPAARRRKAAEKPAEAEGATSDASATGGDSPDGNATSGGFSANDLP